MDSASSTAPQARDWATRLGIKAFRYRNLIKKRWWILAIAVSIGLACESWILIRQPVLYLSTGNLIVGGSIDTQAGVKFSEEQDGFYQTQIKILQSEEIQDRATRTLGITEPQLNGTIEIIPSIVPRANIFSIAGYGSNPEYTQRFVETLMEEYIKYRNEEKVKTSDYQITQIKGDLDSTRAKLDKERADLQDFKEKNNMAFVTEEQKAAVDTLTGLKKEQAAKMTELQQLQNMSNDQLLNRSSEGQNTTAKTPGDDSQAAKSVGVGGGPTTSDLSMQYLQASQDLSQKQAELFEKQKIWKPKHPGIVEIQGEIDRLNRLIKTIKSQNHESTQARIESIQAELKGLDASLAVWDKKVQEASHLDSQYQLLLGAVTTTQSFYDQLVQKIQQFGGEKTSGEYVSIMGDHATTPKRVPPGVIKHLLIGLILSLLAGGVILFIIDRADDRISSSTEMIEYFSEPILGQIPNIDASRVEAGLPLLQHDDERYTFAESLRSLRSSLIFMPNQGELKTLIVTSSIPGEGKSTIASNLGITMALAGARVLLVDADLRRGDLASLFDVDGRLGLSSVLRGEVEWKNALQKTKHQTLTLLPRGPVTNQSGELLLVPIFEPMLQDFKDNFDLVIFNTSPILATDDTATIAPHFDGTLMVIRAQFTGARLARNSLNALYQRQVNVLGLILNCVDTEMPDYYYYRYKQYYAVTE